MREEFEKWFSGRTGWDPYIDESGKYKSMWAQLAWEAWQHPNKHPEQFTANGQRIYTPAEIHAEFDKGFAEGQRTQNRLLGDTTPEEMAAHERRVKQILKPTKPREEI